MATLRVSDFELFRNQEINAHEQTEACLWQLDALMTVAVMAQGFYALPEKTLHNYFMVAGELVEKAINANQIDIDGIPRLKK